MNSTVVVYKCQKVQNGWDGTEGTIILILLSIKSTFYALRRFALQNIMIIVEICKKMASNPPCKNKMVQIIYGLIEDIKGKLGFECFFCSKIFMSFFITSLKIDDKIRLATNYSTFLFSNSLAFQCCDLFKKTVFKM